MTQEKWTGARLDGKRLPWRGLDLKEFLAKYGREEVYRVCAAAGTTWWNYRKIAYGFGSISHELAERLARASNGRISAKKIRPLGPRVFLDNGAITYAPE